MTVCEVSGCDGGGTYYYWIPSVDIYICAKHVVEYQKKEKLKTKAGYSIVCA